MKGKKDKELNQSSLNTSSTGASGSKEASTELSFPDVTPIDHTKCCPRFTSILNRAAGDGVGIEEMDPLQMEMESLLVHAMQRTRLLKLETMILDNANTDKATAELIRLNSPSVLPRTPTAESKLTSLNKREKLFPNSKPTTPNKFTNNEATTPIVRNDIPDTFWQSVEPYCADINDDDIKYLENQIEFYEKSIGSCLQLGAVGKHYSMQWAEEDIGQQIKEGSRFIDLDSTPTSNKRKYSQMNDSGTNGHNGSSKQAIVNHLMNENMQKFGLKGKQKNQSDCNKTYYGPLTQRLISALIEQNLITPFEGQISDFVDTIGCSSPSKASARALGSRKPNQTSSPVKAIHASSSTLEKRLKRSLFEHGILDSEDRKPRLNCDMTTDDDQNGHNGHRSNNGTNSKDDEIATEIRLLNNEIKMVSEQCKNTLSQLLISAKKTVSKQNVRKKINTIDSEINEIYQKFKGLRQSKKPATKKDREKAIKLIKERELLRSQLVSGQENGLSLACGDH